MSQLGITELGSSLNLRLIEGRNSMSDANVETGARTSFTRRTVLKAIGGLSVAAAGVGLGLPFPKGASAATTWWIGAPKSGRINCEWHSICNDDPPPDGQALDFDECSSYPSCGSTDYSVYARINESSYPSGTAGKVKGTSYTVDCDSVLNPSNRRILNLSLRKNNSVILGTGKAQHIVMSGGMDLVTEFTTPKYIAIIASGGATSSCWGGDHVHFETNGTKVSTYPTWSIINHTIHTPWKYVVA